MKLAGILIVLSLAGTFSSPARAEPVGPFLTPADLDAAVSALPMQEVIDRVDALRNRLALLDSRQDPGPERPALRQALTLIHLARSIRLTSEPARTGRPLVAGI